MKNLLFVAVCGVVAGLAMGCATNEAIMIRNSFGFDFYSQQEATLLMRDKKPEWFINGQARRDWEEKNNENGAIVFFYGADERTPAEVAADGLTVWFVAQANDLAFLDILGQIAIYIDNYTTVSMKNTVAQDTEIETSRTRTTGQSASAQARIASTQRANNQAQAEFSSQVESTSSQRARNQVQENFSSQVELQSSAIYAGLVRKDNYIETWEQKIKRKKIIVAKVWVVYGVSKIDIEKAIKEIYEKRKVEK